MRKVVVWTLAAVLAANIGLLVTERRVLMHERLVTPGESYTVPEWGDLGKAQQFSLACRYWTGRGISLRVFWHSANGTMGRDQCPFIDTGR